MITTRMVCLSVAVTGANFSIDIPPGQPKPEPDKVMELKNVPNDPGQPYVVGRHYTLTLVERPTKT